MVVIASKWKLVQPLIPKPKPGGRLQSVDRREIRNAIFYLVRGGIQWRMLPHDFPPWGTVHLAMSHLMLKRLCSI